MEKRIDKTDGFQTYYSNYVTGFRIIAQKPNSIEWMMIDCWNFKTIETKDSRPELMRITHVNSNGQREKHKITICIDLKNHKSIGPFHINVDRLSLMTECDYCRSRFTNDVEEGGLNHMEIVTRKGVGNKDYKMIEFNDTIDKIILHLKKQRLFEDFPDYWVTPVDSLDATRVARLLE